jgi:hypothetical protein
MMNAEIENTINKAIENATNKSIDDRKNREDFSTNATNDDERRAIRA